MFKMAGSFTLALLLTAGAGCGPASVQDSGSKVAAAPTLAETFLADLNAARREQGVEPLEAHPALETIARDKARAWAENGGTISSGAYITDVTDQLHRAGYAVHRWTEGSLIAVSDDNIVGQWRRARRTWWRGIETGDYEDAGIGVARFDGRPVIALIVALPTRTWELRQAAPLADLESVRAQALEAVNRLRADHGRKPLQAEPHLDNIAQRHAEDMLHRAYYDHDSPEGNSVANRVRASGYGRYRIVAENIAKGLFTPDEVVRRWADSSGHRRNLLHRRVTEVGTGVAYGENANGFEVLWVQVFAAR